MLPGKWEVKKETFPKADIVGLTSVLCYSYWMTPLEQSQPAHSTWTVLDSCSSILFIKPPLTLLCFVTQRSWERTNKLVVFTAEEGVPQNTTTPWPPPHPQTDRQVWWCQAGTRWVGGASEWEELVSGRSYLLVRGDREALQPWCHQRQTLFKGCN